MLLPSFGWINSLFIYAGLGAVVFAVLLAGACWLAGRIR